MSSKRFEENCGPYGYPRSKFLSPGLVVANAYWDILHQCCISGLQHIEIVNSNDNDDDPFWRIKSNQIKSNKIGIKSNYRIVTIYNAVHMSQGRKKNLVRPGLEPRVSRLPWEHSTTELPSHSIDRLHFPFFLNGVSLLLRTFSKLLDTQGSPSSGSLLNL